jgi:hypothetical protein
MTSAANAASAPADNVVSVPFKFEWRYIESAPLEGRFDVWAKRWVSKDDSFEHRRFTDCFWRSTHISGCPKEWKPTHWCPILPPPATP